MTAKDFLSQAFMIQRRIHAKEYQIQQLHDMQYSISNTLSQVRVQASHSHDRLGDLSAQIMDSIDSWAKDVTALLVIKSEIRSVIGTIDRDDYKLILEERYINLKRWEDICADNYMSWKTAHRRHGAALKQLDEKLTLNDTLLT